jgi:hypothetical protein
MGQLGSAPLLPGGCPGKSRLQTPPSRLTSGAAGPGGGGRGEDESRRWPEPGAGPARPAQGCAPGRGWSLAQLGPEKKQQAWQLGPGWSGPTVTRGSGRARGRSEAGPPLSLPAPAAAPCVARDVRGLSRCPGAPPSRVRDSAGGAPRRTKVAAGPGGPARGKQKSWATRGWQADNAADRGPRCASGAGRRARGRVCMCAPVSQR